MTIKLKTIILAIPALSKVTGGDLSLRLAYRMKQNISALQKEADFFSEQRQKIFEKYGTPKDDGTYAFTEENEPKAIAELDELLELEVSPEVEIIDIPVTENLYLSVNDIGLLMPFIHFIDE